MVFSDFPATFDEVTMVNGESIGWIKVYSCKESSSPTYNYSNGQNDSDFYEYFEHAIAAQFLTDGGTPIDYNFSSPNDSYAFMTDICSIPVISLNNNMEMSWPIDVDTLGRTGSYATISYINNNWLGTDAALVRLTQGSYSSTQHAIYDPSRSDFWLYWACGNVDGVHLLSGRCQLDYETDLPGVESISFWLGFAVDKNKCCVVSDGLSFLSASDECPTIPTAEPTADPTSSPTLDGCDFDLETYLEECYCDGLQSGLNYGSAHNGYYSNNNINDNEFKDKYYELLSKYQEISDYKDSVTELVFTVRAVLLILIISVMFRCIMAFNKNKSRYGHKQVDFDDDTDNEEQQPFN